MILVVRVERVVSTRCVYAINSLMTSFCPSSVPAISFSCEGIPSSHATSEKIFPKRMIILLKETGHF